MKTKNEDFKMKPLRKRGESQQKEMGMVVLTLISLCDLMSSNSMELVTTCSPNSFYERMREASCVKSLKQLMRKPKENMF